MPFGGFGDSGNGTRPGTEALDVYSELKTINASEGRFDEKIKVIVVPT